MKLATFRVGGADHIGVVLGNQVLALQQAHRLAEGTGLPAFESMLALIEGGTAALEMARGLAATPDPAALHSLDAVTLRSPVPVPPQIRDFLMFEEHLINSFRVARKLRAASASDPEEALREMEEKGMLAVPEVFYQQPIYYKANRFSVIGSGEDVIWPGYANLLDYELELGCFLQGHARDVTAEQAREHIFGYSIFNDVSARDAQVLEMGGQLGPAKGKDFDTGNVIGPWIVTADELDPYDLTMVARVNGEEWSRNSSRTIHWSFEQAIAHVSRSETIHPGEFFGSGTVGGGCGLELERFLSPGDVVELEVEGIGVLRNRIIAR